MQIICDAISTLALAFIPYLHKLLFDIKSPSGNGGFSFTTIILLYLGCMIFSIIFSYLSNIYTWKGAVQFEQNLKGDFFKSIFGYNYKEFSKKSVGEYISIQANDITQLEQDYLQPFIDIFKSINMLIIYGVILFVYVDWRIAILILSASIISVLTPKLTADILANKRGIYLEQVSAYTSRIKDFLEGFKLIQTRTRKNINHEHKKILQETLDKRLDYGKFKACNDDRQRC